MKKQEDIRTKDTLELRKYIRLRSSFPVDFSIVRLQGDLPGLDWQQATTENVSQEGICIESTNLMEPTIKYFRDQNIFLELRLKIPPDKPYIKAVCDVLWYHMEGTDDNPKFVIGLKFRSIQQKELERILWHARLFYSFRKIGIAVCVLIFLAVLIFEIRNHLKH